MGPFALAANPIVLGREFVLGSKQHNNAMRYLQ